MVEKTATPGDADALNAFFNSTLSFVSNISKDMVRACGADPDADLIQANATIVQNQFQKLVDRALSGHAGANQGVKAAVAEFLSVADGVSLAGVGEKTARASIAKGLFGGGFFSWISKHLTEIKKIFREIFRLIFHGVPEWLETILTLIDELWNMISELLGGVFGFSRREIARDISSGEVNSLNEIAATQRLRAASMELDASDDD